MRYFTRLALGTYSSGPNPRCLSSPPPNPKSRILIVHNFLVPVVVVVVEEEDEGREGLVKNEAVGMDDKGPDPPDEERRNWERMRESRRPLVRRELRRELGLLLVLPPPPDVNEGTWEVRRDRAGLWGAGRVGVGGFGRGVGGLLLPLVDIMVGVCPMGVMLRGAVEGMR